MVQDISLSLLSKLFTVLSSTTNGNGASLIGVESSADLESELASLASGGASSGLVDIVTTDYTSGTTGSVVLSHGLGVTPKFAFCFTGTDNAGSEYSNRSVGFYQNNSFGSSQRLWIHHGDGKTTFNNYIMGVQNNPGQANQFPGGGSWERASISATTTTDITITRSKGATGLPGAPYVHRLRIALVA